MCGACLIAVVIWDITFSISLRPNSPTDPMRPHTAHEWKTSPPCYIITDHMSKPNPNIVPQTPLFGPGRWRMNSFQCMLLAPNPQDTACQRKAQEPPNQIVQHAYPPKRTKNESTRRRREKGGWVGKFGRGLKVHTGNPTDINTAQ